MNIFIFKFNFLSYGFRRRKKFAKWMVERMKSVNMSLEEAFSLSYFYGYEDCIAYRNLTVEPVIN